MERIAEDLTRLVGRTPLVRLNRLSPGLRCELLGKLESFNPGSSVKDRLGLAMIDAAVRDGRLREGGTLIEPTSGNTGIALAWVSAVRGYRLILTMPETMSMERRKILMALGAEIVLTPGHLGMEGAVNQAKILAREIEGAVMPQQFANPANAEIHRATTGPEIWEDTGHNLHVFVSAVGTGGTVTGAGAFLKATDPRIRVVAVEPEDSPMLSEGLAGPHMIQGIGAGFVPEVYDGSVVDEVIKVGNDQAMATSRALARKEGLLVGISSGAAVHAGLQLAARPEHGGQRIVVILPDTGERYLSTPMYDEY